VTGAGSDAGALDICDVAGVLAGALGISGPRPHTDPLSPEDEARVIDQLRALGYVE
jgi:DNA-binding IclR family transcriptional regulator